MAKKKTDANERKRRAEGRMAARRSVVSRYFVDFSVHHREWMRELVARYKERGVFPVFPSMIADYYTDVRDKEVALFSSMLMTEGMKTYEQVQDMRRIITDHPFEWLMSRGFVILGTGTMQEKTLDGCYRCKYWKISRLMSFLYDIINPGGVFAGVESHFNPESAVLSYFAFYGKRAAEEIRNLGIGIGERRIRMLMLALATSDGFGKGVWDNYPHEVRCPLTGPVTRFLRLWFPDFRSVGSEDDGIGLFGFERESDFFYAYLAYNELGRKKPDELRRYATLYHKWYDNGYRMKPSKWKLFLPVIDF